MLGNEEVYNYLVKPENEGFLARPKDIGDGKITLGSGLTDPKWVKLYHQRGDVWSKEDNKMAVMQELEERRKWMEQNVPNWDRLPEASQDSLLSYHYNTGFNRDNSPKLFQALQDFNLQEAARQMDATSKNPKFKKGLQRRRREEQEWFLSGINGTPLAPIPTPTSVPVPVRRTPIATPATLGLRGEIERHPIYGPIWSNMSPGDQGRILKMAGDNNISSLDAALPIFRGYLGPLNTHADGGPLGYNAWKRAIEKQKGIKVSEDNTYDYESFYADNPAAAWAMLGENPNSHFTDNYKTVYHPTFSTQINYSGFVNSHNPQGLRGGTWNEKGDTYTMSSDLYNGPVSMDDRINYLIDSEDNGVVLREADGSLPYMGNDTVLGGVLPSVEVNSPKDWNSLSLKEKSDIIRVAINNGITTLPQIKEKYNEFAYGGNLFKGGGDTSSRRYVYDILPSLFAKDGVKITVTSGYRPGARTTQGKQSRHSLHQAADIVGNFDEIRRVLDDPNSNVSRWMVANGYGYLDETSKTGTTKFWHDHNRDHSHYHIGMDSSIASKYGTMMKGKGTIPETSYTSWESNSPTVLGNNPYARQAERMWSKAQPIYQEMLDAGIDPVSAAGILGNMALESGLNPAASNNINGGHWGYLQNDRNITPWIKSNYGGYDHRHQMDYLIAGMQGKLPSGNMGLASRFNGYRDAMRGVTDPEMAAYLWERHYEKSDNEAIPARKGYARYFYDRMMGSNPSIAQQGAVQGEDLAFTPWNSDVFFNGYNQPVPLDIPEAPQQGPVETEAMRAYRQKMEERQQVADNWNKFNFLMQMTSPQQDSSPVDAFGMLASSGYGTSPTSSYSDLGPLAAMGNMFG